MTVAEDTLKLEEIASIGYEKIFKVSDPAVGLVAIICIHNTQLGPALGGTRIYPYNNFEDALKDAKRLAQGMTYKSAVTDCGWGGGKSVIIADKSQKTLPLLKSFAEAVRRLDGLYICAEDMGCTPEDILVMSQSTPFVVGIPHEKSSGNPSPFTAWGIFRGIQATLKSLFNSDSIEGKVIAIQGVGSVGETLAGLLFWHGASLILSDVNEEKVKRLAKLYDAKIVSPDKILSTSCDILSPCAMGGIINEQTIPALQCKAIAGCANNQLLESSDALKLKERGILYAPDFVINSGGLINVTHETTQAGYHPKPARDQIDKIYDQLLLIYAIAQKENLSTHQAAIHLAEARLKQGKRPRKIFMHHANYSY